MKRFLLFALCLAVAGTVLAGDKPKKLEVVLFQDAAGTQHVYFLNQPVAFSDALAVDAAIKGLASKEHAKSGDASFLRAVSSGITVYTYSGSVCDFYTFTGRHMACGQCGGPGCAVVKTITQ